MRGRLVRKQHLERKLEEINSHPKPNVNLEQYTISSKVGAEILYLAAYTYGDIYDKNIIDLGCGTGRLSIGAVLLGAKEVYGVDIDPLAIEVAKNNAKKTGIKKTINWIIADIRVLRGHFHTVLMNPPFGVQKNQADRPFLKKAIEIGSRIYSVHKSGISNREFIKRFIEMHNGKVNAIFQTEMVIPKLFEFHTKKRVATKVDLYQIEGKKYDKK